MVTTTAPARLPVAAKLRLAVEVLRLYVRVRRLLRRHDLPSVVSRLRVDPTRTSPVDVDRLSRAVRRTLALVPSDSRCLVRSLTLIGLLARRGLTSTLVIGVRPGEAFGAHAWVERDGRTLLPADEVEFARLVEL